MNIKNRNGIYTMMMKRFHSKKFNTRDQKRGGNRNEQAEYLDEYDEYLELEIELFYDGY